MTNRVVIGSRGSQLARTQSELVLSILKEANPQLNFNLVGIVTSGDRNHRTPLDRMPGVGVFVKELEAALLDGRIDVAVHSLKDMPTDIPRGLCLGAVMERADPRDVLVSSGPGLAELSPGSRIGTGSLRRAVQLKAYRPDLKARSLRGNVDTRLRKVSSGELDAVIVAATALIRLGWQDRITEYLPLEHFLPPAGQGTLGIEIRSGDEQVARLISILNHWSTYQSVAAERAFLRFLGGGCRAPIAALGIIESNVLKLIGMVADASGNNILHASVEGSATDPERVGEQLAQHMLALGASKFIAKAVTP